MVKTRLAIDIGHNCRPDTGASGILHEDDLTKAVGLGLLEKLNSDERFQAVSVLPDKAISVTDSLKRRCDRANSFEANYYISIHFNAFNCKAHGTEVYAISPRGQAIATKVLKKICKLGYFDRGVKDGSHLYVLKNTDMPAILVEGCFIDSQKDIDIFGDVKKGTDAIAQAIYESLLEV